MIILFDFDKDPEEEFREYELKLRRDISKRIFMMEPLSWYEPYKNKKYEAMVANAINRSNLKDEIVLLPAYFEVLSCLISKNELKDCYYIATPQGISDIEDNSAFDMEEVLMKTKGYAIDYPRYSKFIMHVTEFIKKNDRSDFWKWFKFDRGLY